MDFTANREEQIREMLQTIGVEGIDELFTAVPEKLHLPSPAADDGLSEYEGIRFIEEIASKNRFQEMENYLGGGAYEHHVPSLVNAVCSKSEFLTSYTPYQPEASQGMLQTIFEFQSAICALTAMDVANASVYDGASACAEAVLMSLRLKPGRNRVLVAKSLHPHYREVVEQYLSNQDAEIIELPYDEQGRTRGDFAVDRSVAAVLLQSPNFFGVVEEAEQLFSGVKEAESLSILCGNPLSYALFHPPGEMGVDIAAGDCQPLGLPLQFGGPYVGYMACRQPLVRQLPGRIVGETVDTQGRRGFVLTLQAREQHIRRDKATSNICTNQALAALASLVAILWYGKEGVQELARTNFQRASYLREALGKMGGKGFDSPLFNEFVFSFNAPYETVQERFRAEGIEPGIHLGAYDPQLQDHFLIAVTETKSKAQLDRYLQIAHNLMQACRR